MEKYFEFKFWKEIISVGLVALVIVCVAVTVLYYKLKEYLKKRFGKKAKK